MNTKQPRSSVKPMRTRSAGARPELTGSTVHSIQKATHSPTASLTFFAAVNDCITASNTLHPVLARNVGHVPAWQYWSAWQEGAPDHQSLADRIIVAPHNNFDKNVKLVKEAMRIDSIWKKNTMVAPSDADLEMSAVFAAAPLTFWRRPHELIEITPALQKLLERSDLGDDIPVDLLRPPMPTCYIRFDEEMQRAIMPLQPEAYPDSRVEGVYVFESTREEQRAISLVPIFHLGDNPTLGASTIEMIIDDERQALVDIIQRICARQPNQTHQPYHLAIAQLCTKIFLYWNVEQARHVRETPYSDAMQQLKRLGPKKAAKLRRQVDKLYDRILLGPLALPGHIDGEHGEVSPHWRRGHFRMQAHGPQSSLRKVLFIAPMLIRADRLDADIAQKS